MYMGQLGGSTGEASPAAYGQVIDGVLKVVSRIHIALMISQS